MNRGTTVIEKFKKHEKKFILFSIASLLWLHRTFLKPSRYNYPCQRYARSQSYLFFSLYAIPLATSIKNKSMNVEKYVTSRRFTRDVLIVMAMALVLFSISGVYNFVRIEINDANYKNSLLTGTVVTAQAPSNRVVRVHSDDASNWNFATLVSCESSTQCYWQHVDQDIIDQMVEEGVKAFTGQPTAQLAWEEIIPTYTSGETRIGIKINGNNFPDFYHTGPNTINTLPQIINAVIKGLKESRGVREEDIWVIEPSHGEFVRTFPTYYGDLINSLYPNVQLVDRDYPTTWGNEPSAWVGAPVNQYITDQMVEIDHLIMIPIMKAIATEWGPTGAIKMMQGNIENAGRLHWDLSLTTPDNPDVVIYQNPHIVDKMRLIIGDGIFGAWTGIHFSPEETREYGGCFDELPDSINDVPRRWITYDDGAPDFLFFALDPVAIDSIMYDHMVREREAQGSASGQSVCDFPDPQLQAGDGVIGVREVLGDNDPDNPDTYQLIDYVLIEMEERTTTPVPTITAPPESDIPATTPPTTTLAPTTTAPTSPKSNGACGPTLITALTLIPLMAIKRRKKD